MTDRFTNMKPDDPRPAYRGWQPGDYWGKCRDCGENFSGAKRCYQCADCAYSVAPELEPKPTIQERLDKVIAESMAQLHAYQAAGFKHFRTTLSEDGTHFIMEASVEPFPTDEPDYLHGLPRYWSDRP